MSRENTIRNLFKRSRRPGDLVFALVMVAFSVFLLSQLSTQTTWRGNGHLFAQPRFWPAVSLIGMVVFAAIHLLSSALSERVEGRWSEVVSWASSLEYAFWFILYAFAVPYSGYLPTTIIFALLLGLRAGYRSPAILGSLALLAIGIVVIFKSTLQVRLPAGRVYEVLPDGLREIMLTYF